MKNILNAISSILVILFLGWMFLGDCCEKKCKKSNTKECDYSKCEKSGGIPPPPPPEMEKEVEVSQEKQEIIDSLKTEISEMKDKLDRLNNDQKELEKFSRENFLMKKENEDIIIIREKGDE